MLEDIKPLIATKKPVDVNVIQYVGGIENAEIIQRWMFNHTGQSTCMWIDTEIVEEEFESDLPEYGNMDGSETITVIKPERLEIETLEGTMTADVGDWIIKGVNGEFYPCKPDIFEKTYDLKDEDGVH